MARKDKAVVRLNDSQRQALQKLVKTGVQSGAMRRRAHILLKTDANGPNSWSDKRVADALDIHPKTVGSVRKQFVDQGLDSTLHRKRPTSRQYRKLDGKQEAKLIAIACSLPPQGRSRWTMKLMADRLVELEIVESIDPATVCRALKKTNSSLG